MSVSLAIERQNAPVEFVSFAGQKTAEELCSIGESLGLKHVPHLYSFYPVGADNIQEIIGELKILQDTIRDRGPDWQHAAKRIELVVNALTHLAGESAWKASFG